MGIDAKTVGELRDRTGAGMMAAKKALTESNGDMDAAIEILKKSGAAKAAKRSGRSTGEGLIYSYIHGTGKLGVMLELQCETDFVARNEDFKELAHQISMHIAAADPQYLDVAGVPADDVAKATAQFSEEAAGKPEDVIAKIVEGKLDKWYGESVLLKQEFVMDDSKKIEDVLTEAVARIGENMRISRFARFNIEGGMIACGMSDLPEVIGEEE
jgi:elongation factor Ts